MNKLLIIEDDKSLAQVLQRRLSSHGFEVEICHEKTQALLLARKWSPSHILLDMKLDADNGLSLIQPLKQTIPESILVLLTGFASIATAVEAIRLGADNYLAKPADSQTILQALNMESTQLEALIEEQPMSTKRVEWEHIQQVLTANNGNVSATARQLGMHRRSLQRKLAKKPTLD
ncbi:response regulator transcription factor [Shewanella sp. 202IG2-18]|uniref:response regulator transcription factor n=1 Tax=Parashewanella hymeniacidonis TaxID=2807618 RepID=UPI00196041BA|nr:response regulator transcription factor [Parashewanella hymeniacidonis]MBM7073427.1 response regulator transcription factor [Parashewanella hymeniacidonis]